jgi:hypothetical protein
MRPVEEFAAAQTSPSSCDPSRDRRRFEPEPGLALMRFEVRARHGRNRGGLCSLLHQATASRGSSSSLSSP